MNVIIFSKNRACQLELLLRSMREYFHGYHTCNLNVLYTYDNNFKIGYEKVIEEYPEFDFVLEKDCKPQILEMLSKEKRLSMFLVDDDVFINTISLDNREIKDYMASMLNLTLSLRLGSNITHNYETGKMKQPAFCYDTAMTWKWTEEEGDWAYPYSVDGHIFDTYDLIDLLKKAKFDKVYNIEIALFKKRIGMDFMSCYKTSRIFNMPINRVQNKHNNKAGNISPEYLETEFVAGHKLYVPCILPQSVHQEVQIKWI